MISVLFSIENTLNDRILGAPRHWLQRTFHIWLPPLIIAGALLLSVGLAFSASPRQLTLVLLLLPVVGVILIIMRWPSLGLAALIGSIIIPVTGPSGSNATVGLVVLLLGLWLLDMMLGQRSIQLLPIWPVWSALALILVASLAFAMGQLPWYTFAQHAPLGAQVGGLAIFVLSAGAFLLMAHRLRDPRWLERITWLFLTIGGLHMAGYFLPGLGRLTERFYAPLANGSLFWTWLAAMAFSQAAFNHHLRPRWRAVLGGLALITLYNRLIMAQGWSSGWMPALAAVAVSLWLARPRWRPVLLLAGLVAVTIRFDQVSSFVMVGDNEYSLMTRQEAWRIVLDIAKVNPILGLGLANYYWYTPLFPILGWSVQFNSHSQYVDLIAQTGLLGLGCYLWFFWEVGRLGWGLRERVPAGFAQAYVYGALGGLVGTLVAGALGDWVLPFFYNVGMYGFRASVLGWLFLGGLVAMGQIYAVPSPHDVKKHPQSGEKATANGPSA